MKKRLTAIVFYALFWLIFFFAARLFFILVQSHSAFQNSFTELIGAFWHGIRLDLSTTGYFLLIPVIFLVPGVFYTGNWYQIFIRWYTYLLIFFSSVIVVADSHLYTYWGFRMDYTPMLYLKTPGEALASISTGQLILYILTIILMTLFFIFIYRSIFDKFFRNLKYTKYLLPSALFFMFLTASLIIPIRGSFGVAPINAGTVYFSQKMFLNHAAINSVWNVGTTAFTQKPVKNPYVFGDQSLAKTSVDSLTIKKGLVEKVLNTERPNILIVVLESFSGYLIGPLGGDSLVSPNINRYAREGILFTNFYASGTRTDKALPAILNGYPAQPAQSIIKEPKKTQSLPSLIKLLTEKGYNSSFWYGGEINFANFNSFVIGSGFQSIITENNFSSRDYNSKWGVHDHVMLKTFQDSMISVKEPFVKVVLTLSSHEPFDVPMDPVFVGNDNMTKYRNSVFYADKALGKFFDWAKTTAWWKNTLVIMVADHDARIDNFIPTYVPEAFRIPMIWMGGALAKTGLRITKIGGQIDIPTTLLDQLGIESNFYFGKNLLSDQSKSFAFYTYNEGFGFVTDSSAAGFDLKSRSTMLSEGKNPEVAVNKGKDFLQVLFDDYLKR